MSQITTGIRSILSSPKTYSFFQTITGFKHWMNTFVRDYIHPFPGCRILDLGCGPAYILTYLPDYISYFGCDCSDAYITKAKKKYGDRGFFWTVDFDKKNDLVVQAMSASMDTALIIGVLHHLGDEAVVDILTAAKRLLRPDGRMISLDCVFTPKQGFIERHVMKLDRGKNIRDTEGYIRIVKKIFPTIKYSIITDALRMPYSLLIIESVSD